MVSAICTSVGVSNAEVVSSKSDDGLSLALVLWQLADISPSDNAPPVLSYLLLGSAGGLIHQCAIVISRRAVLPRKAGQLKRTDRYCRISDPDGRHYFVTVISQSEQAQTPL